MNDRVARTRWAVAVSILVATAVGLAVIFVIPLLVLGHQVGSDFTGRDAVWLTLMSTLGSAPIWMPLAPLFAVWAYYSCFTRLTAPNQSSLEERRTLPGWKIFRATVALYLVMAAIIAGYTAWDSYRLNYVCGPGDHIIQSEADAIKLAQSRIFKAHYGSHGIPGYVDEKPYTADFSQPDCCEARRTMTMTGLIQWEVNLDVETIGETKKRHVGVFMTLSNCGVVFDDSYITAEPIR